MRVTASMSGPKDHIASVTMEGFGLKNLAVEASEALIKKIEKMGGKTGDDWNLAVITITR